MNMSGERLIAAPRADVWAALNDPDVLKACIPGCDSLDKTSPTTFEAVATQKVGPVKATFKGSVELSDIVEGEGYTISGEGKGGAAGFAKGGAKVRLSDAEPTEGTAGPATLLAYEAEAKVGGKLAQLGSRLIDGFAKKMADDFFNRFQTAVEGPSAEAVPEDAPKEEKKKSWLKRLVG
jgi:carbon monoxide dehydrogenase subunit G